MSQPSARRRQALATPLALAITLLGGPNLVAQTHPDFSGSWNINKPLSDDAAAKIAEVAGPDTVAGAGRTLGWNAFLPRNYAEGVDRVNVREFLMSAVALLEALRIEQSATEVKTIHGDDDRVRIFNLTRASSGSGADGVKVTRKTRWQGEQLVLESQSGDAKLVEVLTLLSERNQLLHAVHYEVKLLSKPLDVRMVYDKAAAH